MFSSYLDDSSNSIYFFPGSSSSFLTQGLIFRRHLFSKAETFGGLVWSHDYKYYLYTDNSHIYISSLAYSQELWICISSCSLTVSIQIFTRHFKVSILETSLLFLLPKLLYHSLHLSNNSIHPVIQSKKLGAVFYFTPLQTSLIY